MIWMLSALSWGAPETAVAPAPVSVAEVGLEELRAKLFGPSDRVRLVNFWATWCGPCAAEMPGLAAFARSHPEAQTVFVDLDLPKLRASKVEPWLTQRGMQGFEHVVLVDPDPLSALPKLVPDWPDQLPVTLVIAPDGTILRRWHTAVTPDQLRLD